MRENIEKLDKNIDKLRNLCECIINVMRRFFTLNNINNIGHSLIEQILDIYKLSELIDGDFSANLLSELCINYNQSQITK